jgi:aminoglycoside phosphotransferase (APT) family kinase protein
MSDSSSTDRPSPAPNRALRPVGGGREAEIVDLGDGTVLRRYRKGGNPGREAVAMEHARTGGYPVPAVHAVRDDGLVLERVDGPSMLRELRRRPWRLNAHMRTLADLHDRLHAITAPAEFGAGALLHCDLHPDNVLLSARGPVVIDWPNATAGDPAFDVALAWVITATSGGALGRIAMPFFLRHVDREATRRALPAAAAYRIADPNVTDAERAAVRRLVAREAPQE